MVVDSSYRLKYFGKDKTVKYCAGKKRCSMEVACHRVRNGTTINPWTHRRLRKHTREDLKHDCTLWEGKDLKATWIKRNYSICRRK